MINKKTEKENINKNSFYYKLMNDSNCKYFQIRTKINRIIFFLTLPITFYIVFLFFFYYPIIYVTHIFTLPINRFSFQVANYDITSRILTLCDDVRLGKTSIAYSLRNMMFKQYNHIIKTNNPKTYESIGTFYNIHRDFIKLTNSYNNAGDSKLYLQYKEKYLSTVSNILKDYTNRNITKNHFLSVYNTHSRSTPRIYIPNRITFYVELAYSFFIYTPYENTDKYLEKLKEIFYNFDTVLEQENSQQSYNLEKFNQKQNIEIYKLYYPQFIYNYSTKIIRMESELHPDTLCQNTYIISKYHSIQDIYSNDYINNLLATKCRK